jgi:probable phosphoglycerate mutase
MPSETRFHLIRHGLVAPEWRGRIYGDRDVPLSPAGEAQMRAAAGALAERDLAAVVSSGLARAEFGAALLRRGRGVPRRDEPALREISRGAWAGLTFAELETHDPGAMGAWCASAAARPPGGESLADLEARVAPCMDALAAEFPGGEIALVTHSWVSRVLVAAALGLGPLGAHRFDLGAGQRVTMDWPAMGAGRGASAATLAAFASAAPPARTERWHRGPTVAR